MKEDLPPLGPSEWAVYKAVTRLGQRGASVEEVVELLRADAGSPGDDRSASTIATLLRRVRDKGYLRSALVPTDGRRGRDKAVFYPFVPLDAAKSRLIRHFLEAHQLALEDLVLASSEDQH